MRIGAKRADRPQPAFAAVFVGVTLVAAAGLSAPGAAITSIPGSLSAVSANSASSAWAVGQTTTATTKTLIVHWNGTSWAQVPSPSPGALGSRLAGVDAASAGNAWAVGNFSTSSGGKARPSMRSCWP